MEDVLVSKDFGTSLDRCESFMNDYEEGIAKGDPKEEGYQGHTYPPEID